MRASLYPSHGQPADGYGRTLVDGKGGRRVGQGSVSFDFGSECHVISQNFAPGALTGLAFGASGTGALPLVHLEHSSLLAKVIEP